MPTYFEVMNRIYMPHILRRIKEREDEKVTTRPKHISYQAQREQCRLNKFTYIEKVNKVPTLFCNYPFPEPDHKKGLCLARTCTDMREIPEDVVNADTLSQKTEITDGVETIIPDPVSDLTPGHHGLDDIVPPKEDAEDKTAMPVCSNE